MRSHRQFNKHLESTITSPTKYGGEAKSLRDDANKRMAVLLDLLSLGVVLLLAQGQRQAHQQALEADWMAGRLARGEQGQATGHREPGREAGLRELRGI